MTILINSYLFAADLIPDLPLPSIGHAGPEHKFESYNPVSNANANVATRIIGINRTITLKIANWAAQGDIDLYYKVVASLPAGWQTEYPANFDGPLIDGSTFTVTDNDYIIFGGIVTNESSSYCFAAFSILNNSNSDAVLGSSFYTEWNC